jgi:hypothetical protein
MFSLVVSLLFFVICLIGIIFGTSANWPTSFSISILSILVSLTAYSIIRVLLAIESNLFHSEETMTRLLRHFDQLNDGLNALNENILLSEDAKGIAFRDKDLQVLRQAIEEKIGTKDWEAALYLADQIERKFGYRKEAEQFRKRVNETRGQDRQHAFEMTKAKFEDFLSAHEWDSAAREMEKIQGDFPENSETGNLPDSLEQAKNLRKKELIKEWDQAVQRNEVDRSIEIIRELDQYLSPSEVEAFQESARGIFRAKLHNLGVQFSLFVVEKLWDRALSVGEEIVTEFPNSRMAQEVKESISSLRQKAQSMKQKQTTES